MGCSKNASKKEVQSNIGLHQEARRIPNKQSNFTKGIRKRAALSNSSILLHPVLLMPVSRTNKHQLSAGPLLPEGLNAFTT